MATEDNIVGLGVFVCIFNRDFSKIMLLKRNKEKREQWDLDWGNVGGRMEFRETSEDACLRETKEEIGLDLDKSKLKLIYVKETPNFLKNVHAVHFIYAITIDESAPIHLNSESEEYKWFDLKNLPDRMLDKKEEMNKLILLAKKAFKKE